MKERQRRGGKYFYVYMRSDGDRFKIETAYDFRHGLDDARYELGNYYIEYEDACRAIERMKEALA